MRCPKCQYISFDNGDRCRNCGYDFSLNERPPAEPAPDLAIQDGTEALGPLSDFSLHDTDAPGRAGAAADELPAAVTTPPAAPNTGSLELPLFTFPPDSDAPLVTPGNTPRVPLSVRRGAPLPKPRPPRAVRRSIEHERRDAPAAEPRLALETAEMPVVPDRATADAATAASPLAGDPPAPLGARGLAAAIDLALIAGIDLAVVYFTLRMCNLTFADIRLLPPAPLLAFLLLMNGGYFAAFVAAAGQTLGKMAAGIRVVPGDPVAAPTERVPLGNAIVRAAAYLVSALPAGLGFLPAAMGNGRALHDRLADTRVIKA